MSLALLMTAWAKYNNFFLQPLKLYIVTPEVLDTHNVLIIQLEVCILTLPFINNISCGI